MTDEASPMERILAAEAAEAEAAAAKAAEEAAATAAAREAAAAAAASGPAPANSKGVIRVPTWLGAVVLVAFGAALAWIGLSVLGGDDAGVPEPASADGGEADAEAGNGGVARSEESPLVDDESEDAVGEEVERDGAVTNEAAGLAGLADGSDLVAGVDDGGARGLLEADRIVLEGAVSSSAEQQNLVARLESVVGSGNVDASAVTVDDSREPLEALSLVVPSEIGFQTGRFDIEPAFFPVLDSVVAILELDPNVVVSVGGHTDSEGLDYENLVLSQRRAESVVDYIVGKGINSFRLEPQGRGATAPVADNETPEGRARNRRIEFTVFGLGL